MMQKPGHSDADAAPGRPVLRQPAPRQPGPEEPGAEEPRADARADRLRAALRANLGRRKAQARNRSADPGTAPGDGQTQNETGRAPGDGGESED